MDLTKGVVPVTALAAVIAVTAVTVTFQKDTQRDIAAIDRKLDVLQKANESNVTETQFENWRLRLQLANRDRLDVPEYRR